MWWYLQKNVLQFVNTRAAVRLDLGLNCLSGPTSTHSNLIKFQQMFAIVKSHLARSDTLIVEYVVRLSADVVENEKCHQILK